jgi:hypothetical protein
VISENLENHLCVMINQLTTNTEKFKDPDVTNTLYTNLIQVIDNPNNWSICLQYDYYNGGGISNSYDENVMNLHNKRSFDCLEKIVTILMTAPFNEEQCKNIIAKVVYIAGGITKSYNDLLRLAQIIYRLKDLKNYQNYRTEKTSDYLAQKVCYTLERRTNIEFFHRLWTPEISKLPDRLHPIIFSNGWKLIDYEIKHCLFA